MTSKTVHGYLVLADISGFTSFMASTELEHAHDILSELMELLVAQLTPPFSLVEIEGDAVYVCAPESLVPHGETLVELFQATYAAFRDRVESIRRQTTCTCNACRLIPTLDVKFITTCGNYVLQSIAGKEKPVGSDVNLVHRLAKNPVIEMTGWRAYILFTEGTLKHMALESAGMFEHTGDYEQLGQVATYSLDLGGWYQQMIEARRVFISPQQADYRFRLDIPAAPPVVWDWLNDPQKRTLWQQHEIRNTSGDPRRGVGTQNHCVHGKDNIRLQMIVDWRPFDYFTMEDRAMTASKPELQMTNHLEPIPAGTRLTVSMRLLKPMPGALKKPLCIMMMRFMKMEQTYRRLARLIEEDEPQAMTKPPLSPPFEIQTGP